MVSLLYLHFGLKWTTVQEVRVDTCILDQITIHMDNRGFVLTTHSCKASWKLVTKETRLLKSLRDVDVPSYLNRDVATADWSTRIQPKMATHIKMWDNTWADGHETGSCRPQGVELDMDRLVAMLTHHNPAVNYQIYLYNHNLLLSTLQLPIPYNYVWQWFFFTLIGMTTNGTIEKKSCIHYH